MTTPPPTDTDDATNTCGHDAGGVSAELRARLSRLADEGFTLVRMYGDYCETCGTQSQASMLSLSSLLAKDVEAADTSPQMVERERAVHACRQSFDRGWAAAEAYRAASDRMGRSTS